MTPTRAHAIYDILAEHAGAPEHARDDFVYTAEERPARLEFRFQGRLGFGGKVYAQHGRVWVAYYVEDRTAERDEIVRQTNAALNALAVPQ